ncbi:MAG: N-acetylmuramoyl-L-alanine amidase [Alphaproteobacteria bacterium]
MNIIRYSSPNFDERNPAIPLSYILLHYTGMPTGDEALQRLCDPKAKVSAHYLIEEDGRIFKLVDEAKRAWHAGQGFWKGITDINSASIGIELVNPGHQNGYRKFPPAQIDALKNLLGDIIKRHNLSAKTAVLGHADIAPSRKEDPGELFPWQELAQIGIGLWPETISMDYEHADDDEVQNLLRAIGYDCPTTGAYDRPTRAALLAFQRHYDQANLTGTPEKETVGRLRALSRMLS